MKNNLPMTINQNNKISKKIKNTISKSGKIAGYSLALLIGTVIGITMPVLALPAVAGVAYSGQKLLNNTIFKSYKDLSLITAKNKSSTKIYQDPFRIDILKVVNKLTDKEKAGFLQMQTILGLGRLDKLDKRGNRRLYKTDTHGIVRATLKDLNKLGYIQNYEEKFIKQSNLIFPKLAFGNIKSLREKKNMYNVKFEIGEKPLDIEDEELKKIFPLIFNKKKGIVSKYGYSINMKDGTWTVDYKGKSNDTKNSEKVRKNRIDRENIDENGDGNRADNSRIDKIEAKANKFKKEVKKETPSQIEQNLYVKKILASANETEEERNINNEKNVDNNFYSDSNSNRDDSVQK